MLLVTRVLLSIFSNLSTHYLYPRPLACMLKKDMRQFGSILTILTAAILIVSCGNNNTEMTNRKAQDNFDRQLSESMKDTLFALNLDSVKSKYGDRFMELRTIINRHDPIGLLAIGAPEDEYESEVKTIIIQLDNEKTEQQIHDLVYQEFIRWFNDKSTAGTKENYTGLAKDIYDWTRK